MAHVIDREKWPDAPDLWQGELQLALDIHENGKFITKWPE